jgi:hypothetical protein
LRKERNGDGDGRQEPDHDRRPDNDGTYIVEFRTAAMEVVRGKQPRLDFMREALAEHIARAIRRKTKSAAKEKRDT